VNTFISTRVFLSLDISWPSIHAVNGADCSGLRARVPGYVGSCTLLHAYDHADGKRWSAVVHYMLPAVKSALYAAMHIYLFFYLCLICIFPIFFVLILISFYLVR